jgi:hypothetical protein
MLTDGQDQEDEDLVVELVHDPVVPRSDPPFAGTADQLLGTWGPRIGSQQFDRCLDASAGLGVEPAELAGRRGSDFDAVRLAGHAVSMP